MSIELMAAYLRERYRSRVFVPLALLLGAAGTIAVGAPLDLLSLAGGAGVSYLLVLACRVWDDLEDRERDRVEHPDRVLVHDSATAPWLTLILGSAAVAIGIIAAGPGATRRLAVIAAGSVALFTWYRVRRALRLSPVIGTPIVLAKYPAIAYVAAPAVSSGSLGVAMAVLLPLYAAICIYEVIDDTQLRGSIP